MNAIPKPSVNWTESFKLYPQRAPVSRLKTEQELRSEAQWRKHHEGKEPKHWRSLQATLKRKTR